MTKTLATPLNSPASLEDLRSAMRYWVTGVAILATRTDNLQHGMTVNSFTSVSIDPPLIIVALEQNARTHNLVLESNIFGVTILSSLQEEISTRFAGRQTEKQDRFQGLKVETLVTGSPFIIGGMAFIDCRVKAVHEVGHNTLFIGKVVALKVFPETETDGPLLYYSRSYHQLKG